MNREMLTINIARGGGWDPKYPFQVLSSRLKCLDTEGNIIPRLQSVDLWTGEAVQIVEGEEPTNTRTVQVAAFEFSVPGNKDS